MHKGKWNTMKKKLPRFKSDREAEEFVEKADLTEYDLSAMRKVRFEFQPKSERVNMRLPRQLLEAVRASAARAGFLISASSARRWKTRFSANERDIALIPVLPFETVRRCSIEADVIAGESHSRSRATWPK
jgi:predicted DNA binding CopG/RHH family protein